MVILFLLNFVLCFGFTKAVWASGVDKNTRVDSVRIHRGSMLKNLDQSKENSLHGQRLASSTFPVRMKVQGSALCVTSEYCQLLPIYTRGGTFYMAMRLNKGLNWLNGLPRGRYLINNQPICIP